MAVTLDSYRQNIGLFNNTLYRHFSLKNYKHNFKHTYSHNKHFKKPSHKPIGPILIFLLIFIFSNLNINYIKCNQNINNKKSHIYNGNIKLTSIKFIHFNKGNSKFENKIDDIHFIIQSPS